MKSSCPFSPEIVCINPSFDKMNIQLITFLKCLTFHIPFLVGWRCYHTTCLNTVYSEQQHEDGVERDRWPWPRFTFSDSVWQSISAQTDIIAQLFSARVSQEFYDSCQVDLVCLFSDFNPEEFCAERRTFSLWGTHKLALHSACLCFQGGMCFERCCLCVLSSAGVSACCLCLFFLSPSTGL